MSIVVTCKNGHRLRAADRKAGTVGRCPACGAEVVIPKQDNLPSESSIMRILGVGEALRNKINEYDAEHATENTTAPAQPEPFEPTSQGPKQKVCPNCDWEIDEGYKICPHCRYYFME